MTITGKEICGLVEIKASYAEDFIDILLSNNYTVEISNAEENKLKIIIKKEINTNEAV